MTREEAIKVASEMYGWLKTDRERKALETLIPELAETEDDRIRKIITDSVFYQYGAGDEYKDVLDYLDNLEKQKEQKEIPLMNGDADLYFYEWNQQNVNPTKRQCFMEGMGYAERLQKEQKLAWSEEDKEIIANATKQLYSYADSYHNASNYTREKEVRKVAYELKSLRPQSKQEWSEEDRWHLDRIRMVLESWDRNHISLAGLPSTIPDDIDWLEKKLKGFYAQ